jgi:hypothetical protein
MNHTDVWLFESVPLEGLEFSVKDSAVVTDPLNR